MHKKPTYEELEQKVKDCGGEKINCTRSEKSRNIFKRGLDALRHNIAILDDQGNILFVNKAWRKFAEQNGAPAESVSEGKNYLQACKDASGNWSREARPFADGIQKILSGESEQYSMEYPCHSPEKNRWFIGHASGFTAYGTNRVIISHEDITHCKLSEKALKDSEDKYRNMFARAQVALFRTRISDGEILEINERFARMAGYSSTEECMADFHPRRAWADSTEREKFIQLLQKKRVINDYQTKFIRGDGKSIWANLSASIYPDEGYMEGSIDDITEHKRITNALKEAHDKLEQRVAERTAKLKRTNRLLISEIKDRKKAEEELRESENYIRSLVEAIPDLILVIGRDGTYLYFKAESEEELAIPSDRIVGSNIRDSGLSQYYIELIYPKIEKAIGTRKVQTVEYELEIRGQLGYWEARLAAIGETRVILIARNITKRVHDEKRRIELERHLKQVEKAESLSRMAGAVAHHFNNMLLVITGNLALASRGSSQDTNISQYLAEAETAANRASEMSRLMLTYLGQKQMKLEHLDLSEICADYLERIQPGFNEQLNMETDIPPQGPAVTADRTQMEQILRALINNAREAMEEDSRGNLRISVTTVPASEITAENRFPSDWERSAENYACITVSDTGRGIPEQDIGRIFDPFFTDKFTGRGLGLAVTLGIVKALEGCITVKSAPGKGSTFRVYLPPA